ncbi:MAG: bacillithiol biosynthesis deacetylase BshB1 [Balneola sp.]
MKLDVLVFAAHPDDAELNIGGTICSLVKQGKKVGVIDLTQGEMGTRGTIESRKKEADNASSIMNLSYRVNLDLGDSILENSRSNQLKIIAEIRKTRPTVCITGAPHDRHPDHGKSTQLVLDSLFYSGLLKIETDDLEPWRPSSILHYMQDRPFEPDFVFDITETWELKKKAMLAFSTQFNVSEAGQEPETYISTPTYFKQLEARARYFGHLAGFEFGEPLKYYNGPAPLSSFNEFFTAKSKR